MGVGGGGGGGVGGGGGGGGGCCPGNVSILLTERSRPSFCQNRSR